MCVQTMCVRQGVCALRRMLQGQGAGGLGRRQGRRQRPVLLQEDAALCEYLERDSAANEGWKSKSVSSEPVEEEEQKKKEEAGEEKEGSREGK